MRLVDRKESRTSSSASRILVGAAAIVLCVTMSLGRPEPLAYLVAHALELVGGVAGSDLSLSRAQA
jgi:hypothetical protein